MKKLYIFGILLSTALCCFCAAAGCAEYPETQQYTVTFRQEGFDDKVFNVEEGASFTDAPAPAVVNGYTVLWEETDLTCVTQDLIVEAVYEKNIYTVNYHLDGGANGNNPATYTVTDEVTLEEAKKENALFLGWYLDASYQNRVSKIEKGSFEDLDLYAKFRGDYYAITYHLSGGENHSENPAAYFTEEKDISLKEPRKYGYAFLGWYTDETFSAGAKLETVAASSKGAIELYACWEAVPYEISYVVQSGGTSVGTTDNATSYSAENIVTFNDPVISDSALYKFEGWYLESEFLNRAANTVRLTGDLTVYAKITVDLGEEMKRKLGEVPAAAVHSHTSAVYTSSVVFADDEAVYYRLAATKYGVAMNIYLKDNAPDSPAYGYVYVYVGTDGNVVTNRACDANGELKDSKDKVFVFTEADTVSGVHYVYVKIPLSTVGLDSPSDRISLFDVGVNSWSDEKKPSAYSVFTLDSSGYYIYSASASELVTDEEFETAIASANWLSYVASDTGYKKYAATLTEKALVVMVKRSTNANYSSLFFDFGELHIYASTGSSGANLQDMRLKKESGETVNKAVSYVPSSSVKSYRATEVDSEGCYVQCVAIGREYLESLVSVELETLDIAMYEITNAWDGAEYVDLSYNSATGKYGRKTV